MASTERTIANSLFLLRLVLGLFLLQWTIEKFVKPEVTARIFETFYFIDIGPEYAWVFGVPQLIIVLAFLAGFLPTVSYGLCFAMHLISTLSTWQRLIDPFEGVNHLFTAAVPVLAAFWVLFALRDRDTLFNVSHWLKTRRGMVG